MLQSELSWVKYLDKMNSSKDFGRAIHNLTGGISKARMNKYSNLQLQRSWRNLMLSTGEISIRQKIEEENKQVHAGMSVRLIDIPVHKGVVIDPHGLASDQFVMLLKRNCPMSTGLKLRLVPRHMH